MLLLCASFQVLIFFSQVTSDEESAIGEKILVKGLAFSKTQARLCLYTNVTLEEVEKVIAKIEYVGEEMASKMGRRETSDG